MTGAKSGQRIVLYAKTPEFWWVQPFAAEPFTDIRPDSHWSSSTHLGTDYAALLVNSSYVPSPKIRVLPRIDGAVTAIATRAGTRYVAKIIHFGGYDWEVNQLPNNRGGQVNAYSAANAWTDAQGFLHLRTVRSGDRWVCSEVALTHALGEGSYSFTVRDVSQLDPAAVSPLSWRLG